MGLLIFNIKKLVQVEENPRSFVAGKDMATLASIDNAFLLLDGEHIEDFGSMEKLAKLQSEGLQIEKGIDATGRLVMPSFCDSHTHLVYAGSREIEYVDKIRGLTYEQIAKRGGGILNSVAMLHNTGEEQLYMEAMERIREIIQLGYWRR